ncbi:unnamed protein product [Microthlaspi erraticum]|uniref:F-box domain-containing protein n=1 Tax=Microthlaspi erraticum TaxID=1685480 RepID=A0A6D2JHF1_9BRAS|nr:unnamed protein product [Microthlaspi erraticum]
MDPLSSLPDEVHPHILSFLTTKEAASTSLLSKRWRNLFALVPNLDIDDSVFLHPEEGKRERDGILQSFMDFVDRVLDLQGDSPLNKFSLKCKDGVDSDRVDSWICKALQRGVSELDLSIDFPGYYYYRLPEEMFVSRTLVKLKLTSEFDIHWWPACEDVSLPLLKSLCICSRRIFFEDEIEPLLPCFPVLEELQIESMERKGLDVTVSSGTLTKLTFFVVSTKTYRNPKSVCFDTPNLLSLRYSDLVARDYPLVNMEKLVEARLALRANDDQIKRVRRAPNNDDSLEDDVVLQFGNLAKLMKGIHNVQELHLCPDTLEVLSLCCESMPVFNNLKTLVIHGEGDRGWQAVPVLLRNSPHLQTLYIEGLVHYVTDKCGDACDCIYRKDKGRSLTSCPVKELVIGGFTGTMKEMNMIEHFLDYFPCLNKVEIYIDKNVLRELRNEAVRIMEMIEEYNMSYRCHVGLMRSGQ